MKTFDIKIKDKKILSADRNNPSVTSKPFGERLIFFVVLLVIVFGTTTLIFAWSNPTVAPPGGNLSGFLNTGSTAQTKTGALTIATSTYLATTGGNVGIGTTTIGSKLGVLGNLAIGGTYGALAAPTGGVIIEGNVGIGTTGPAGQLEVKAITTSADGILRLNHSTNDTATSAFDLQWYGGSTLIGGIRFSNPSSNVTNMEFSNWNGSARTVRMGIYGTNGNVGIGTTGPGYKFQVSGVNNDTAGIVSSLIGTGAAGAFQHFSNNTTGNWAIGHQPTTDAFAFIYGRETSTAGTPRVTIEAAGNVGIGTTGPISILDAYGTLSVGNVATAGTVGKVQITTGGASPINNRLTYGTDGTGWKFAIGKNQGGTVTEQLTIQDNGNVGIGTTGPGYLLTVNSSTPGCNGCTAWTNYSDIRLKDNVASLSGEIMDKIMQLNPVTFNYNDTYYSQTGYSRPDGTTPTFTGFVAQDLQEIFPEMVNTANSGYLDTNLSNLQIYLVKGIQEQQREIEELQREIEELKRRK